MLCFLIWTNCRTAYCVSHLFFLVLFLFLRSFFNTFSVFNIYILVFFPRASFRAHLVKKENRTINSYKLLLSYIKGTKDIFILLLNVIYLTCFVRNLVFADSSVLAVMKTFQVLTNSEHIVLRTKIVETFEKKNKNKTQNLKTVFFSPCLKGVSSCFSGYAGSYFRLTARETALLIFAAPTIVSFNPHQCTLKKKKKKDTKNKLSQRHTGSNVRCNTHTHTQNKVRSRP